MSGDGPSEGLSEALAASKKLAAAAISFSRMAVTCGNYEKFWRYRPYLGGESFSGIDWKQSARTDELFVREREKNLITDYFFWINFMELGKKSALKQREIKSISVVFALIKLLIRDAQNVFLVHKKPLLVRENDVFVAVQSRISYIGDAFFELGRASVKPYSKMLIADDFTNQPKKWKEVVKRFSSQGASGVLFHCGWDMDKPDAQYITENTRFRMAYSEQSRPPISELSKLAHLLKE